jgi:hypothetical protein
MSAVADTLGVLVAHATDLVVMKVLAGRGKDLDDLRSLLASGDVDQGTRPATSLANWSARSRNRTCFPDWTRRSRNSPAIDVRAPTVLTSASRLPLRVTRPACCRDIRR